MSIVTEGPDSRGRYLRRCARSGCTKRTAWTAYGPEAIHFQCTGLPRWHDFGGLIELALAVVGINQAGWNTVRGWSGFTKPCKCGERVEDLNKAGGWFAQRWQLLVRLIRGLPSRPPETNHQTG